MKVGVLPEVSWMILVASSRSAFQLVDEMLDFRHRSPRSTRASGTIFRDGKVACRYLLSSPAL